MSLTKKMAAKLDDLFGRYQLYNESIKTLEGKKAEVSAELLKFTDDAGGELQTTQFKSKVVTQSRRTLSVDLLVKAGVKPTVIEKCYVETTSKPYVSVHVLGEKVKV